MSRINTNVSSLIGQRVLGANNKSLNVSLERLSTGLRINRGKDDPAGLIASQNLRAEKSAVTAAISNAERADQVVNIAEGGLDEIASLLTELQGLVTSTANTQGLSTEEKNANQLQIDSIVQTIDRISSATSFQGTKLLDGSFDYSTTGVNANVNSFKVNGAKLDFGSTRSVDVVVTDSAQIGGFFLSFGGSNLNLGGSGATDGATSTFTLEIAGARGSRELSFASGTTVTSFISAINSYTDITGVKAVGSGTGVRLESDKFGSDQFVSVKVTSAGGVQGSGAYNFLANNTAAADTASVTTFAAAANKITDKGADVSATINGITATTAGTKARINTDFLDVEVDLATSGSGTTAQALGSLSAFTINSGGADFQLAGRVDIAGKVSLGIGNVAARSLGRTKDGSTNYFLKDISAGASLNVVDGDLSNAQAVVENAIKEVSGLRGRLGAFQKNTIGATIRSLGISLENTTAAESVIRDTDFASETAALTRSQILSTSAQQILSLANSQPQSALQLLG